MKEIKFVVLSGPSGSGKSTVMKALEDLGFFCVDNMPVTFLPKFMDLVAGASDIHKVAAVVDVRERGFLKEFTPVFSSLKASGYRAELVYLEATDEALVRRFSETRRRHPIAASANPLEGVLKEREMLSELKGQADRVIDTTALNVHQLRDLIRDVYSGAFLEEKMTVNIISFGYKYGIPPEADLVFDIRFLPNPHFVEAFKGLDGKDPKVREFVLSSPETREFMSRFGDFLKYLVPLYGMEGKSYLTIAVGCTGGRHRSVAVTDELAADLIGQGFTVKKKDRDVSKS